jgi:cobalt/nickel transport protein
LSFRLGLVGVLWLVASPAAAHFQTILPSADVLPEGGTVTIDLVFTHPAFDGPAMAMAAPRRFGMVRGGETVDLLASLEPFTVDGASAWRAEVALPEPGAAVLFVEPEPYFEPAEGRHIVHYAKVVVDSWASGEGWDEQLGLPVEIEPLARPTGLWTGNLFRGVVRAHGEPVPYAEIEVAFVNDGRIALPNDAFGSQVIRADAQGVFAYAMPFAGWWGFAALTEADETLPAPDGTPATVELGGLIWVRATDVVRAD